MFYIRPVISLLQYQGSLSGVFVNARAGLCCVSFGFVFTIRLLSLCHPSSRHTGSKASKAYSDLIIERKIDYRSFRTDFESRMGRQLIALLLPDIKPVETPSSTNPGAAKLESLLKQSLQQIDRLCRVLVDKGLVAQIDSAALDDENIVDWAQDVSDLQWSIALDGDITLKSQILLQEQGFRLYPNYARYAIQTLLQTIDGQSVEVTDYYMDTDYNSDPDKFDVKEVLLNIVLESM